VLNTQTLKITAQGYQERVFGKLMISTGRNPAGAFVAELQANDKQPKKEASSLAKEYPYAFICAGDIRIGGGDRKIAAFEATGKEIGTAKVDGKAHSLAVVRGRFLASTSEGALYCFTPNGTAPIDRWKGVSVGEPEESPATKYVRAHAGSEAGYCLVLGQA